MKKYLSIALRVLFAALGLAYIAYSLTWSDSVHLDKGYEVAPGVVIQKEGGVTVPILEGRYSGPDQTPTITIAPVKEKPELRVQIPRDQVSQDDKGAILYKPGIITSFKSANLFYLLLGLLIIAPLYPLQTFRWYLLLKCQNIDTTFYKAFRLTMVGCFFNYCIPGTTGGDVVKAWYVAKNSDRRAVSVMTVIFDRITGLLGLIVVGGLAGLLVRTDPTAWKVTVTIWSGVGVVVLLSAIYFSRRIRSALYIDTILEKTIYRLPGGSVLSKVDDAATAYSTNKLTVLYAVLLSIPCHLLLASATALAAYALGSQSAFLLILTVMPVVFLAGSIPISPQGVGIMEALAIALLLDPGVMSTNQIVGMLLMIRFYQVVYSLLGGVFLLKGDIHMHPEKEAETASTQPAAPQ
jgi:glycosyltransferase 2 family protein